MVLQADYFIISLQFWCNHGKGGAQRLPTPPPWPEPLEESPLTFDPSSFFFFKSIIFREGKAGREGEKHQCVIASHTPPHWRPGQQPRHVPWLGIEPATLWFIDWHSIHWATSARAVFVLKLWSSCYFSAKKILHWFSCLAIGSSPNSLPRQKRQRKKESLILVSAYFASPISLCFNHPEPCIQACSAVSSLCAFFSFAHAVVLLYFLYCTYA